MGNSVHGSHHGRNRRLPSVKPFPACVHAGRGLARGTEPGTPAPSQPPSVPASLPLPLCTPWGLSSAVSPCTCCPLTPRPIGGSERGLLAPTRGASTLHYLILCLDATDVSHAVPRLDGLSRPVPSSALVHTGAGQGATQPISRSGARSSEKVSDLPAQTRESARNPEPARACPPHTWPQTPSEHALALSFTFSLSLLSLPSGSPRP